MAEIDKSLPNTKSTIEVPGEQEVQTSVEEDILKEHGNTDIFRNWKLLVSIN